MKLFLHILLLLVVSLFSNTWERHNHTTGFIHDFICFSESPRGNMLIYGNAGIAEFIDNQWVYNNRNNSMMTTDTVWDLSFISNDSTILQTRMGPPTIFTDQ